jgi:cation transport regulator
MPYKKISELPDGVKSNLPKDAQKIFKETFNNAWDHYKDDKKRKGDADREEVAFKVAWSSVKEVYKKNSKGDWIKK